MAHTTTMVTKEKIDGYVSERIKGAKFQKTISENSRPLASDRSIIITKLRYLNTWDNNPMKLYAMVEVNNDQEPLTNQCHHPGKI